MSDFTVRVTGLENFQRGLKQIDRELPKELRRRLRKIAGNVATVARGRMHFKNSSRRAERSVKGETTRQGARIVGGGAKVPYYPWLDFGGTTGRGHRPGIGGSGSVKRSMPPGGRYIYPAIASESDKTERDAKDAIGDIARKAGFGTPLL